MKKITSVVGSAVVLLTLVLVLVGCENVTNSSNKLDGKWKFEMGYPEYITFSGNTFLETNTALSGWAARKGTFSTTNSELRRLYTHATSSYYPTEAAAIAEMVTITQYETVRNYEFVNKDKTRLQIGYWQYSKQ